MPGSIRRSLNGTIVRVTGARDLKKRSIGCRRTYEFPFSRFARARKSAHIISKAQAEAATGLE
jgi:hypothetical protein